MVNLGPGFHWRGKSSECYKKSIELQCESVFCGFVVSCLIATTKFIQKWHLLKVIEKLVEGYKHKSQVFL